VYKQTVLLEKRVASIFRAQDLMMVNTYLRNVGKFVLLCALFWVIPQRLNFTFRRFGTCCLFHLHRRIGTKNSSLLPAYEDGTECSETSAYKIQTPGNYPEEIIQHSEHGESLKSRNSYLKIFGLTTG
jgi:hypothetical protein